MAISSVVVTDGIDIPTGGAASPQVLVQAGQQFTVTVTLNQVVSTTKATILAIGQDSYPHLAGSVPQLGLVTVPAGATTGSALVGPVAAMTNRVVARATVIDGTPQALDAAPGFSAPFDVVDADHLGAKWVGSAKSHIALVAGQPGGTSGSAVNCDVTAAFPYCADVYFPATAGGDARLAFTPCDTFLGCGTDRQVLQVIFNASGVTNDSPVTVVYRCDKTACGNIGVPQVQMLVGTGDLTVPLTTLDKCRKQGVQTSTAGYCFDAKQSTKDNAGDVYLYVLTTVDPRLSWP